MVSVDVLQELELRPLTRAEYLTLAEAGTFEDERVELLYGIITKMATKGPTHDAVIERLNRELSRAIPDDASVRIQSAYAASEYSSPEPDVAIVPLRDYDQDHPSTAFLIIEVAESSLKKDRTKARIYAENGVPEYWIVNLVDKLVEVHTDIVRANYSRVTPYKAGETLRPCALPGVELPVAQILR